MTRSRKGSRSTSSRRPTTTSVSRTRKTTTNTNSRAKETVVVTEPVEASRSVVPRRPVLKKALIGAGLALLILILAGGGYLYWTVQKTLPTLSGTATLPGLSAPVVVARDPYGVPHITGATVEDVYMGQGYIHAQDRLFQMFLLRAAGQGRLSEAFGTVAVDADRFFRTVGFRRAAEADLAAMKETAPDIVRQLEAYSRGVNEFVKAHKDGLPLEFSILGLSWEDWQPVDTFAFGKLQAWDLSETWNNELLAADMLAELGPTRTAQLLPLYPPDSPTIVPNAGAGQNGPLLQAYAERVRPWLLNLGLDDLGSNSWVVHGSRTTTGKPLLANDPHLSVRNPSIWYQVHLATQDGAYDATGFSFAGVPGIITGHNRDIAWGVTNTGTDVQDLYIEKTDSAHPNQYQVGGEWKPMRVLTETIKVKEGETVTQTVRITEHGPLISEALPLTPTIGSAVARPFALRWTASDQGTVLQAVAGLQKAKNWEEFRAALSNWDVPGQNFVYADRNGNIGYQMTGKVPLRLKGNGSVPVSGSTGDSEWKEYVPYDQMPSTFNPAEGYVATANNKPFGADYKYQFPGYWAASWRIERIMEMLNAKEKFSIDDFKEMQLDTKSVPARAIAPYLARLNPDDERTKSATEAFKTWDADLTVNSATASIYEVWYMRALSETFSDELGLELYARYLDANGSEARVSLERLLQTPDDPWWDRTDTPERENRDTILTRSLTSTVTDMAAQLGNDMVAWEWGKLHKITPSHPFGPALFGLFNLPSTPIGGDGSTVSVAAFSMLEPFGVRNHQSYRMIVDMADFKNSLAIYGTGQSGQPMAKHWGDMLPRWQNGEYNPLLYDKADIDRANPSLLTLNP